MNAAGRTLGIIPARGGSKGIPRKNARLLAGRPLIAWTIEAAAAARSLDDVIVSTEDDEIAAMARDLGASVPFMRPAELAGDATPGVAPVLHALDVLPGYDAVVLLQPTSPLRTAADIDGCVDEAVRSGAPAAVSVAEPDAHPAWMYHMGADGRLVPVLDAPPPDRRQGLAPVYALNGAVYYARTGWLQRHRTFLSAETAAYVMPADRSLDIDTPLDWDIAEFLLSRRT